MVGIGASAGGLAASEAFFRAMAPESDIAFVLIQHLDPTKEPETSWWRRFTADALGILPIHSQRSERAVGTTTLES